MYRYSLIVYVLLNSLSAEPVRMESGINRNTLIELYTSEGCSSCPPAEKYLNKFRKNKDLWKTWVPVAFHVNYWDYIGWKDRYATKKYGQRQSLYASLNRASTVYTPAFKVNGSSWRPGLFSKSLKEDTEKVGNLVVTIKGKRINANYQPNKTKHNKLLLNVAVLGMDLSSHITKGENKGRQAKHEFVVVGFNSSESSNAQWEMMLPDLHYLQAKNYALAVWVSGDNDPTPIQAVGGNLPGYKQ